MIMIVFQNKIAAACTALFLFFLIEHFMFFLTFEQQGLWDIMLLQ